MEIQEADPGRFVSHAEAAEREANLFEEFYLDREEVKVAELRRRRRRVANTPETPVRTVSLVEEDGVLYWRDGIPARAPGRQRRRGRQGEPETEGAVILTREFRVIAPNRVIDAIGALDRRLNDALEPQMCSRLRKLARRPDGKFGFALADAVGPFAGRTLVLVHGTFSNANHFLEEFQETDRGRLFLDRASNGKGKYDRILLLDHPTLCVSPVINALELGRCLAGSSGQIDVIAHSRGGLVVRWWLEAFGSSLRVAPPSRVRAVLAGSPLHGTSLAAPDRIQHAMSLFSNIGTFAEKVLKLTGLANPFLWVAGKLIEVIVSVTGALARTPLVDALTALVPGLSGQSAVSNNYEIGRLRLGPAAVEPAYYAVMSNFETKNPGWRFWRNFRKDRAGDLVADIIFPGDNDLIVDTPSMSDFGVPQLRLAGKPCDFGTSETVWHCNYFRQEKTIDYIADAFALGLD